MRRRLSLQTIAALTPEDRYEHVESSEVDEDGDKRERLA